MALRLQLRHVVLVRSNVRFQLGRCTAVGPQKSFKARSAYLFLRSMCLFSL